MLGNKRKARLANQFQTDDFTSTAESIRDGGLPPGAGASRFSRDGAGQPAAGGRDERKKVGKGVWRMPRLLQATKDVISCDKPRAGANGR